MNIQRLSIDFNYQANITKYERNRLMIMGNHLESLFFRYGLQKLEIPECNFVHFAMVTTVKDLNTDQLILQSGARISIVTLFDKSEFFKQDIFRQLSYIADAVYDSLKMLFTAQKLNLESLENTYQRIQQNNFFSFFNEKKMIHPLDKKMKIIIKAKSLYDCYIYKMDYAIGSEIKKSFDICFVKPIYLISEHDGYPKLDDTVEVAMYPDISGWVNEKEFHFSYAHKQYSFTIKTETLHVTENSDLKRKFVNWASVHDGSFFLSSLPE